MQYILQHKDYELKHKKYDQYQLGFASDQLGKKMYDFVSWLILEKLATEQNNPFLQECTFHKNVRTEDTTISNYDFPKNVTELLSEFKDGHDIRIKLGILIEKISKYLKQKNLQYDIATDIFVDQEYSDWQKIKVIVKIAKDLDYIYQNIKYDIYDMMNETIPINYDEKILLKCETLR